MNTPEAPVLGNTTKTPEQKAGSDPAIAKQKTSEVKNKGSPTFLRVNEAQKEPVARIHLLRPETSSETPSENMSHEIAQFLEQSPSTVENAKRLIETAYQSAQRFEGNEHELLQQALGPIAADVSLLDLAKSEILTESVGIIAKGIEIIENNQEFLVHLTMQLAERQYDEVLLELLFRLTALVGEIALRHKEPVEAEKTERVQTMNIHALPRAA